MRKPIHETKRGPSPTVVTGVTRSSWRTEPLVVPTSYFPESVRAPTARRLNLKSVSIEWSRCWVGSSSSILRYDHVFALAFCYRSSVVKAAEEQSQLPT